ncbi:hypothetical protein HK096_009498, partial [Nowakowskiella sp. JEL0078]
MQNLPFEIIQKIAKYLSFQDSYRIKRSSKFLFEAIQWNHYDPIEDKNSFQNTEDPLKNAEYMSPIEYAAMHGALYPFKLMLKDSRIPIRRFPRLLSQAPVTLEIANLLLSDERIDPSSEDNFSIRCASADGHVEVVKLLLADPRVDPSANYNYAIEHASEKGHAAIVKLLLADYRVHQSLEFDYALERASQNGHVEVVKVLLADARVDPSNNGYCSIVLASSYGHAEVLKLLLADGIRSSHLSSSLPEPLISLIIESMRESMNIGLDNAMLGASSFGNLEVVKVLIADSRVDPSSRNNKALHRASENGHVEIVKLLLADSRVAELAKSRQANGWSSW